MMMDRGRRRHGGIGAGLANDRNLRYDCARKGQSDGEDGRR
jgi:hypothetical protein